MNTAYVYDGTFEGLLTAVFESYARKEEPFCISETDNFQLLLDTCIYNVETDLVKAERVLKSAAQKIGSDGVFHIYTAFLSEEEGREKSILYYLRLVFKIGRDAKSYLGNEYVMNVMQMARKTGGEAHLLKGFMRFREMENGVLYAEFSPKTDCIAILAPHFKSRLNAVPFVINDLKRKKAAIYDTKRFDILPYEAYKKPEETESEKEFEDMWKQFYKTVAIAERKNERCRMTHMPKRYWRYMCEMQEI